MISDWRDPKVRRVDKSYAACQLDRSPVKRIAHRHCEFYDRAHATQ